MPHENRRTLIQSFRILQFKTPATQTAMHFTCRLLIPCLLLCVSAGAQAFSGVVLWQASSGPATVAVQGHADPLRAQGRLNADTPLHVGSITKLFTAVLTLQQVAADRLSLDAAIGRWLPELPPAAAAITVRQLLQHRSGLAEFHAEVIASEGASEQVVAGIPTAALNAQALELASGPPCTVPGGALFYNNLDYLLLAIVLERVSGKPYAALLDERIFTPLQMRSSYVDTLPANPKHRRAAPDATVEAGKLVPPLPTTLANYGASGAAVSTANDLARFAAGLLGGRILARPLREQLFAEGLSVWAYDFADARLPAKVAAVERQGAAGSYRSNLVLLPEQRGWLIVLANTDGEDYSTWMPASFTHRLLASLLAGEPAAAALKSATASKH